MSFSLLSEPWIPVQGGARKSLLGIFSAPSPAGLVGAPTRKISLLKLLLGICQAACTPGTEKDWERLSPEKLAEKCRAYLEKQADRFELHDNKLPFLQLPKAAKAQPLPWAAIIPEFVNGNTTALTRASLPALRTDAEKAVDLVTLMSFALGGKKTDNSLVLTPGYAGKTKPNGKPITAKCAPSVGFLGFLHAFVEGKDLWETLWLNLWTRERLERPDIEALFPAGLGTPPWEEMPSGEDDERARELRDSYIGRLIPLSRFCLIDSESIHLTEGISYPGYSDGRREPTAFYRQKGTKLTALWADPEKRPWRDLPAILIPGLKEHYRNLMLESFYGHLAFLKKDPEKKVKLWCGGLKVSSNAGEFYVSGGDDYVEASCELQTSDFDEIWYQLFEAQMAEVDERSKKLYGAVLSYQKELKQEDDGTAARASNIYWERGEPLGQDLVNACGDKDEAKLIELGKRFTLIMQAIYDEFCPSASARELEAWTKCRPYYAPGQSKKSRKEKAK